MPEHHRPYNRKGSGESNMTEIAILGYGIVGSGVAELLDRNADGIASRCGVSIRVKRILETRAFPDSPHQALFTRCMEDILCDDAIRIVVETIGGTDIAYGLTRQSLLSGRHVVTSNKELITVHGAELLELAARNNVHYLFEASMGGGIPIIRSLSQCFAANEIHHITGILNGTTNDILTQMRRNGTPFPTALPDAQKKGTTEADPATDIQGLDSCRKLAILSTIAYDAFIDYRDIHTESITGIGPVDMAYAALLGGAIRFIAESRRTDAGIHARVGPVIIPDRSPLANVDGVTNAILVEGNALGEAMFYGRGSGKFPTASAVVADIMDIVRNPSNDRCHHWLQMDAPVVVNHLEDNVVLFVRLRTDGNLEAVRQLINRLFDKPDFYVLDHPDARSELAFSTGLGMEMEHRMKMKSLDNALALSDVEPSSNAKAGILCVLRHWSAENQSL